MVWLKRILALAMVLSMILTVMPFSMMAETTEPTAEPALELDAELTAEPTAEPTAVPALEPAAEITADTVAESTAEPIADPALEPTSVPTTEPALEPTTDPTAEPITEPVAEHAVPAGSTYEAAISLILNETKNGKIIQETSVVIYCLKVFKTGSYQFASGGDIAVKATLLDADKTKIASLKPNVENENGSEPKYFLTNVTLSKNSTYYLMVESNTPGKTGAFSLLLTQASEPAEVTPIPTEEPTEEPAAEPIAEITAEPTAEPVAETIEEPTAQITAEPVLEQTAKPTPLQPAAATPVPTANPSVAPVPEPVPATQAPAASPLPETTPANAGKPSYTSPPRPSGILRPSNHSGLLSIPEDRYVPKGINPYPESAHSYSNNIDEYRWYGEPNAIGYWCLFSSNTFVETNWDYISFYDENYTLLTFDDGENTDISYFTGDYLSNRWMFIGQTSFYIRLYSDASNVYYGYKFTSIIPIYPAEFKDCTLYTCEQYGSNQAFINWSHSYDNSAYADRYQLLRSINGGNYEYVKTVYDI